MPYQRYRNTVYRQRGVAILNGAADVFIQRAGMLMSF